MSYLAIDIGTSSIKAVEKDDSGRALRWGILERKNRPFHASIQPIAIDDAASALGRLLAAMGAESKTAVASVPAFLALSEVADTPDSGNIAAAAGTFTMASVPMGNGKFFLAAIPNAVAETYAEIFRRAGLRLERITLESSAAAASLSGQGADPVLLIDVGDRSTTFTVAGGGRVLYFEETDFAASSGAPNVIIEKAGKIVADFKTTATINCGPFSIVNGLQK